MTQIERAGTDAGSLAPDASSREEFRVIAILAAYNEDDIVAQAVGHLIGEGVLVYFIDHGSTDDTVAAVAPYLGKGLLHIEHMPGEAAESGKFVWERILARKQALAQELDAHWFIHQDADEFRESPWSDRNLRRAIRSVDRLGYSAIDFEVLNFRPTHNDISAEDVREAFRYYESPKPFDRLQVRCWKKTAGPVDLVSTGGHEAQFEGRQIFPIRFILRHYPVRGQAHGERKVFVDRRPRILEAEHAKGWHIQYDDVDPGHDFISDADRLTRYDADAVRLWLVLRSRQVEELEASSRDAQQRAGALAGERQQLLLSLDTSRQELDASRQENGSRQAEIERLGREGDARNRENGSLQAEIERLGREGDARNRENLALRAELAKSKERIDALAGALDKVGRHVDALLSSASWRVTSPLRAALRTAMRLWPVRDTGEPPRDRSRP